MHQEMSADLCQQAHVVLQQRVQTGPSSSSKMANGTYRKGAYYTAIWINQNNEGLILQPEAIINRWFKKNYPVKNA